MLSKLTRHKPNVILVMIMSVNINQIKTWCLVLFWKVILMITVIAKSNQTQSRCSKIILNYVILMIELSDSNWKRTQNHLIRKRTLNHLAKLIWPVWPNGWVFVYELSGFGFESSCSHLKELQIKHFRSTNSEKLQFFLNMKIQFVIDL